MIIFGSTGLNKNIGGGEFYCPQCSAPGTYQHIQIRQFFTLYFIPLIPMGSGGEFIKCNQCGGSFTPETIHYDPIVERDKTATVIRQICIAVLNDIDRCKPDELLALCDILSESAGVDVEPEDVANEVRLAQEANIDLLKYLRQQSAEFSEQGKWLTLIMVRRVLESGTGIDPLLKERMIEVGKALGLRKKHVSEFFETPMVDEPESE